jgi:hypothetical protein
MVLMNALVSDIVFEFVRLIFLGVCIVAGVFVGKKLRDASNAKKSTKENNGN